MSGDCCGCCEQEYEKRKQADKGQLSEGIDILVERIADLEHQLQEARESIGRITKQAEQGHAYKMGQVEAQLRESEASRELLEQERSRWARDAGVYQDKMVSAEAAQAGMRAALEGQMVRRGDILAGSTVNETHTHECLTRLLGGANRCLSRCIAARAALSSPSGLPGGLDMESIREGVKALNEGRIRPWEDVKRELGLDDGLQDAMTAGHEALKRRGCEVDPTDPCFANILSPPVSGPYMKACSTCAALKLMEQYIGGRDAR